MLSLPTRHLQILHVIVHGLQRQQGQGLTLVRLYTSGAQQLAPPSRLVRVPCSCLQSAGATAIATDILGSVAACQVLACKWCLFACSASAQSLYLGLPVSMLVPTVLAVTALAVAAHTASADCSCHRIGECCAEKQSMCTWLSGKEVAPIWVWDPA